MINMNYSTNVNIKKKIGPFSNLPFSNGSCGSSILLQNNLETQNILSNTVPTIDPNKIINSSTTQTIYLTNYDNHTLTLGDQMKKNDQYINLINQNVITINSVENVKNEHVIEDDVSSENIHLLSDDDGNVYCVTIDEIENNCDNLVMEEEELQMQSQDDSINENLDMNIDSTDLIQNETEIQIDSSIEDVDIETISEVVEALKCKWCSFTTLNKDSLIVHRRESHSQKVDTSRDYYMNVSKDKIMYICGRCSKTLPSVEDCRNHMINDHKLQTIGPDDKNIDSDKQDEITESPESSDSKPVKNIQNTHTIPKIVQEFWLQPKTIKEVKWKLKGDHTIRCTNSPCLYRFKSVDVMEAHRACHTESTLAVQNSYQRSPHKTPSSPYVCTTCEKSFNSWPSCSLHLWREHSICLDLLTCPLCFTVKTHCVSKMIQHIARHWRNQQDNSKVVSSDDNTDLPRWYATTRCEICKKMFSDSKVLSRHVQSVHKKIKPFICNVCNHSATTKHMMQLHMRQHTGEKPYACDFCSYRTGDHNTMRRHRMKHTGERPYKCSHCSYSCIQSVALKYHLRKHH